ncbi:hypothetical protein [Methanosarcina barkeri]|uniref:hypothetical protein n=1 Tax=Methanosarcina barkeri TaxID=2208 RepID=UPI00003C6265|nr:hypothetical protein [Methanosarcina barkeri]
MHKLVGGYKEKLPFADSRFDVIVERYVLKERSVKDKSFRSEVLMDLSLKLQHAVNNF